MQMAHGFYTESFNIVATTYFESWFKRFRENRQIAKILYKIQ